MAKASHPDFTDFVQRQQPTSKSAHGVIVDWDSELDYWMKRLAELYDTIADFLDPYIEDETVSLTYSPLVLTEENIGTYQTREMHIAIGRQIVTLRPVGTMLIGTKGRVDILGSAGRSRFMLTDKEATGARGLVRVSVGGVIPPNHPPIDWVWKIVGSPPAIRVTELTKDTLFQVLMEVSNG